MAAADLLTLYGFTVPDDIDAIVASTESCRPSCLPQDKQDLAQMWYIASILQTRADLASGTDGVTTERVGDVSRTYAPKHGAGSVAQSYMDKYNALARLCGGSITVGTGLAPEGV